MGKLLNFILALVMIDLLLTVTGQISNTVTSILLSSILDIKNFTLLGLWTQLIGLATNNTTGLIALILGAGGTIATGVFFSVTDTKLFIPMGLGLSTLASDFISFYTQMINSGVNSILATFIFAPILVSFIFILIEWIRGRD